jgi:hypothetical protein
MDTTKASAELSRMQALINKLHYEIESQRAATEADAFIAGLLGQWLAEHPDDADTVVNAAECYAKARCIDAAQPCGMVFNYSQFYTIAEREAGVPLS